MKLLVHSQTSTDAPWSLGNDKYLHLALYSECNYLSMLGLKLIHVSSENLKGVALYYLTLPDHAIWSTFYYRGLTSPDMDKFPVECIGGNDLSIPKRRTLKNLGMSKSFIPHFIIDAIKTRILSYFIIAPEKELFCPRSSICFMFVFFQTFLGWVDWKLKRKYAWLLNE